ATPGSAPDPRRRAGAPDGSYRDRRPRDFLRSQRDHDLGLSPRRRLADVVRVRHWVFDDADARPAGMAHVQPMAPNAHRRRIARRAGIASVRNAPIIMPDAPIRFALYVSAVRGHLVTRFGTDTRGVQSFIGAFRQPGSPTEIVWDEETIVPLSE